MTEEIQIQTDCKKWGSLFFQTDKNDHTPMDLTIRFKKECVLQAKQLFEQCGELKTIHFNSCITSSTFEGEIAEGEIIFCKVHKRITAAFRNKHTDTVYGVDITVDVNQLTQTDVFCDSSANSIEKKERKSAFDSAYFGRCLEINLQHITDEDFAEAYELIINHPPMYFAHLHIEFFVLCDYYVDTSPGGIGIKFNNFPQDIGYKKFLESCQERNIPKNLIDVMYEAGIDGIDILTLEDGSQKIEGLELFE